MAIRRTPQLANGHSRRIDRATFRPGDYGRVTQADGIDRWWVRSSNGERIALSHQRVVENDDGTITLLYLKPADLGVDLFGEFHPLLDSCFGQDGTVCWQEDVFEHISLLAREVVAGLYAECPRTSRRFSQIAGTQHSPPNPCPPPLPPTARIAADSAIDAKPLNQAMNLATVASGPLAAFVRPLNPVVTASYRPSVPILKPESVPADIRAEEISLVGRYAIQVRWSDGHSTGISPFDALWAACACETWWRGGVR